MDKPASVPEINRRSFVAGALAAPVAASALAGRALDNGKMPQKQLGKTGVMVPVIGLGTAPSGFRPEREAVALFNECIDAGVTYLDTAPEFAGYGKAQEHLAHVLKERRDEVFVVTKVWRADGEEALALLKQNLKEMGIERADLVYAHSIGDDKMPPDALLAPSGVCKALDRAKGDGLTRFVGVSGHNRPDRFLKILEEWKFDVMMTAVSLVSRHIYDFEGRVWPRAAAAGVGLAAMKILGGGVDGESSKARMPVELHEDALRYALNLPNVNVVVVGMRDSAQLKQNLRWLAEAKAHDATESARLVERTKALAAEWKEPYGPLV